MKKMYFLISVFVCFISVSCTTVEKYPYFITGIRPGTPNEWAMENISRENGVLYTQLVPLTARDAAFITVGKVNNMLVAQAIINIQSYSPVSWSYIELDNMHFNANAYPGNLISNSPDIYIRINEPQKFIKALQQQKIFNAELMVDMYVFKCKVNGNLELF
jgi:hypothetical protein